ncbi:hypothetical protein EZS27_026631 [termite gut metagenome]|uniref:Uncharacterized protein n=1 Tax=termite gut metagenome TaxID=433724 RepID=A0A5J4QTM2_9ZZZZ
MLKKAASSKKNVKLFLAVSPFSNVPDVLYPKAANNPASERENIQNGV